MIKMHINSLLLDFHRGIHLHDLEQVPGAVELKWCIVEGHLYHLVTSLNPFSCILVARESLCVRIEHF